jgi:hypothetical protein
MVLGAEFIKVLPTDRNALAADQDWTSVKKMK